jgi:hypothetical protein
MTERSGTPVQPIDYVRDGMRVVDSAGRTVGDVAYVQMGDAEAATTRGAAQAASGIVQAFVDVGESEPDVPEPLRSRLLRHGFVKIDGPGLTDTDRYVRADRIAGVVGEVVTLTVPREELPVEE